MSLTKRNLYRIINRYKPEPACGICEFGPRQDNDFFYCVTNENGITK